MNKDRFLRRLIVQGLLVLVLAGFSMVLLRTHLAANQWPWCYIECTTNHDCEDYGPPSQDHCSFWDCTGGIICDPPDETEACGVCTD